MDKVSINVHALNDEQRNHDGIGNNKLFKLPAPAMASSSRYFPTSFQSGSARLSLKTPCNNVSAISFLKVHSANVEKSRCRKNCKTDFARARRDVLAGGAASESEASKL
ncbi:hypothetical protein Bca4012_010457 [Brassica carinata]